MTELTFLVELLLNHKLQKSTKDMIASRLKEVEEGFATRSPLPTQKPASLPAHLANQAPSTLAALARHPDLAAQMAPPDPQPVAIVAQTSATQAAMASRAEAINEAMSGKIDKVHGRPRKF